VIRAFAALALASAAAATASASTTETLSSKAPWWEKVTLTVTDDGAAHSCTFESSLTPSNAQVCDVDASQAAVAGGSHASATKDGYTRITFERRFNPGTTPDLANLQPGETLLGGQVMALAIDAKGSVKGCKVVAVSGSMKPDYSCEEASAEKFDASAGAAHAQSANREGFMTVLVYGHQEHVV